MLDEDVKEKPVGERVRTSPGTVLLVDDSRAILRLLERAFLGGPRAIAYDNAEAAVNHVRQGGVDVVVTDITMPGMDGLALLRAIRAYDPDLPVILLTGRPTVETAVEAIEHGVFRYLTKPFQADALKGAVRQASQLYRLARIKREALGLAGVVGPSDRAGLEVTFERALERLFVDFQPIVSLESNAVIAYEALLRSAEPLLPGPLDVIDAAERLGRLFDVGRLVRGWAGELFRGAPAETLLFLNLHPRDLLDTDLLDATSALAPISDRVVFEITERVSLANVQGVRDRVAALRARGFRIAVDDLGAGYAGLTSFATLEPDIVKLDMTLTRDIDQSAVKQKIVAAMVTLCREMGMMVITEGVETEKERDTVRELGCDIMQGFAFAHPGPPFPTVTIGTR